MYSITSNGNVVYLAIPIVLWRTEYAAELVVTRTAAANSEVNKETTTKIGIGSGVSMRDR